MQQSDIRSMTQECTRVGGLNLAQGVCDLGVPAAVAAAAKMAIDQDINSYTPMDGLPELKQAIAAYHQAMDGIEPDRSVIVSAGATGAFYAALRGLLNPGDEVLVFEPYYGYHVNTILAAGMQPRYFRLEGPDWQIDWEVLAASLTERTRAILINTPSNPSGKVFTDFEQLAGLAEQHDLIVFSDEIYARFVYDGAKHISPLAIDGLRERSVMVSGFSKVFSITGWRVGYCICPPGWFDRIAFYNDLFYVCAPAPLQIGVARGLGQIGPEFYSDLAQIYYAKRQLLCAALESAGLKPSLPQGAYYVLADISRLPGSDSYQRSMWLLEKTGVAAVPGRAFYHDAAGDGLARFCFARGEDVIGQACERLQVLD